MKSRNLFLSKLPKTQSIQSKLKLFLFYGEDNEVVEMMYVLDSAIEAFKLALDKEEIIYDCLPQAIGPNSFFHIKKFIA